MKRVGIKQTGFTIVELLIVVVVIAILAAITIVSYNGIRQRATEASVQATLSQVNEKVLAYAALHGGAYPDTLADAEYTSSASSSVSFQYTSDNTASPAEYALTASDGPAGTTTYYVSSTQTAATSGIAPGHNLIVWDKSNDSTAPVAPSSGVAIDTSVFRNTTASMRLSPGAVGKYLRNNIVTGSAGQIVTAKLWIKTDSNWNGASNNSKIRFGANPGGALLANCGYGGVKTSWTEITCSYALTSTNTSVALSVGNDGSTGNIWLDDMSLSIK